MNRQETAKVLAKIQIGDNRTIDRLTLDEWHDTIGHLDFVDAIAAVRLFRQESTDYLMPAHVISNAKRVRVSQLALGEPDPATCVHRFIGRDGDCVVCGFVPGVA